MEGGGLQGDGSLLGIAAMSGTACGMHEAGMAGMHATGGGEVGVDEELHAGSEVGEPNPSTQLHERCCG